MMPLAVLFLVALTAYAETVQAWAGQPPLAQPLVREGTIALKLVDALKLGTAANEAEAESMLGAAGIAPRNGWIADYPVTPDTVGELRNAVIEESVGQSKSLTLGKNEALKAFEDAMRVYGLSIEPSYGRTADASPDYDTPGAAPADNYYDTEGPPVVTYYDPPADYYDYYTWVPYPFWWADFWFPGFFILADFHRVVIVNKRPEVITNHVMDRRTNKMAVIDPLNRMAVDPAGRVRGRNFMGAGNSNARSTVSPGARTETGPVSSDGRQPVTGNSGRIFSSPSGGVRTHSSSSFGGGFGHCSARC
jgi:hypothetical protein